jgi:tetratricopeptide (TPR) repeat protein
MGSKHKKGKKSKKVDAAKSTPSAPTRRQIWLVSIGLVVAILAVYGQVLKFEFVTWDDPAYIYENPLVVQGVSAPSVGRAFSLAHASNWHPVTWISHMVDVQLFGLQREQGEAVLQGPGGHHLVSVLLHIGNSLLLLLLLFRMTGAFWPSALCAALFAIHPLRAESVAWVSERKDVLSGLFFMLTLLAYHGYAQRKSRKRYLLVFISLALGLMAKPMLVSVPFVLLLLDLWPLRRWNLPGLPPRRLLLEKLPLLAMAGAACLVTMCAQKTAVAHVDGLPWAWRIVNAPVACVMYVLKTLWPANLACFYPHPADVAAEDFSKWIFLAGAATLVLLLFSIVALRTARSRPYLLVGWLWFLVMLAPVIGVVQVGQQAWADRYAYLPLVGVYLAISWALIQWVQQRPTMRQPMIAGAALVLLVLFPLTWRQAAVWRDSQSLYEHALAVTKDNFIAHNNLGNVFARSARPQEAILHYEQALRIKPNYAEAHSNLGDALQVMGRHEEAVKYYESALSISPDIPNAHNSLGLALNALGRYEEALGHCREALRIKPDYAEAYNNLGVIRVSMGEFSSALRHFEKAVQLKPDYATARDNVRAVREGLGEQGSGAVP